MDVSMASHVRLPREGWLGWGVCHWAWFSVSFVQKEQVLDFQACFCFFS